jgi:hypothetical protein
MTDINRTLYDISQDLVALYERLEELGGDVTSPEVEQEIDTWFEDLGQERDQKLDNYAALIRELESRAEARKAEARRLADRARRDAEHADYLKNRLVLFFQQHGLKTVETPRYRLTVQRSGGRTPVVLKSDPEVLPEEFQRWKVSADLDAIREALESGATLDFAELGERSHYVRIS